MAKDKVLVTGSGGFIGSNLVTRFKELGIEVLEYSKLREQILTVDYLEQVALVIHLAGSNRPEKSEDFNEVNVVFTKKICDALYQYALDSGRFIPIVLASSSQAENGTAYGNSKKIAEDLIHSYGGQKPGISKIYRFPNVFGKWCRANYNSVVATFCERTILGLPLEVHNPETVLELLYIDDLVDGLQRDYMEALRSKTVTTPLEQLPSHKISLSDLAETIQSFPKVELSRDFSSLSTPLISNLFSTYLSMLPQEKFISNIQSQRDDRGIFIELTKHRQGGQVSYLSCEPGAVRGNHYHHSKVEFFFVVAGEISFNFKHVRTGIEYIIEVDSATPQVVKAVPGWTHSLKNTGDDTAIIVVWANEIFDSARPDTHFDQIV